MNKLQEDRICVFTSFTFAYLNRARVLAHTLKENHPEWELHGLITDRTPAEFEFDPESEPFDLIAFSEELEIQRFEQVIFQRNIVEACTAVKGAYLKHLLDNGASAVIYLDPDIAVISSLKSIEDALGENDIVLTPHQITPEPSEDIRAILDNEIASLQHGIYNLGFIAVRNGEPGRRFSSWWNERLLEFCFDDIPQGLFTDQRWCDLIPAFFENVGILRDPGLNVASWNLSHRVLSFLPDGRLMANDSDLKFFHFTKLGKEGETMTQRYAKDNLPVYELWNWYRSQVTAHTDPTIPGDWWYFGSYDDGTPILEKHRKTFRTRQDLQEAFPNPYDVSVQPNYKEWLIHNNLI